MDVEGDGMGSYGSCSSVFFENIEETDRENLSIFLWEWRLDFLGEMSFGIICLGGCYADHKLVVVSSEFKGWEKTDTVKLVALGPLG